MAGQIYINGKAFDFNSASVMIDGEEVVAITSVNYKPDRTSREKVFGTHAQAIATTDGQLTHSASITLVKATASALRQKFAAAAGANSSWMDYRFDIVVNYEHNGLDMTTDEIIGCAVSGPDQSHQNDTSALTETWELDVTNIKLDGLDCVADPLY